MADPSPLAGLLDRAGRVFSLAWQLACAFRDEYDRQGHVHKIVDPTAWGRQRPAFEAFCAAVTDLRDVIQNPPDGFAPVAEALMGAARVARQIRDVMRTTDGQAWQSFLEFRFQLNSVAASGEQAIHAVVKARRLDDPFAFVDQPEAGTDAGIDTTPTVPKPPAGYVEEAGRGIPLILADVPPNRDGTIELVASHLMKRLRDARHTLAAAQWAVHEAVRAGRLLAGPVEVELPGVGVPNPGWGGPAIQWHGGGRGTKAIPKGKPTPFDCFKVVATESLWAWWRSLGEAEPVAGANPADVAMVSDGTLTRPDDQPETDPAATPAESPPQIPTPKRSTGRGEGRVKLIAALTRHHQYENGSCLHQEPINNNELARQADVSPSTASAFFQDEFKGHDKYRALCQDSGRLASALKLLNGEYAPHDLYGRRPAGEDDRGDE